MAATKQMILDTFLEFLDVGPDQPPINLSKWYQQPTG